MFTISVDVCMREVKARMGDLSARLILRVVDQLLLTGLFADDTSAVC